MAQPSLPSSPRHNALSDSSETPRSSSSSATTTTTTSTTTARRKRKGSKSQGAAAMAAATAAVNNRTTYALAYPAPVFIDKTLVLKHLRPRLYVQLQQQQAADGRHFGPCIDVVSLTPPGDPRRLVSVVKRQLKRIKSCGDISSSSNKKKNKGMHMDKTDILLVRTDHDDNDDDDNVKSKNSGCQLTEEDILGKMLPCLQQVTHGTVLAVLRPGANTILTRDGRAWTASRRANGSFEFLHVDQYGLEHISRWVAPRHRASSSSPLLGSMQLQLTATMASTATGFSTATTAAAAAAAAAGGGGGGGGGQQGGAAASFNFSMIDPSARRHAVLATLDASCLQIKNTYVDPADSSSSTRSPRVGGDVKVVDEATRTLILATSVWLDLHLGWSPSYEAVAQS